MTPRARNAVLLAVALAILVGATIAFPRIQGADCCGRIVAVGHDVPGERIGERVLVRALQITESADGAPATVTLGSELDGAFA